MTYLSDAPAMLRRASSAYGGIEHYLRAAGDFDRALSAFVKVQTMENLTALNGAVARCSRFKMQAEGQAAKRGVPDNV